MSPFLLFKKLTMSVYMVKKLTAGCLGVSMIFSGLSLPAFASTEKSGIVMADNTEQGGSLSTEFGAVSISEIAPGKYQLQSEGKEELFNVIDSEYYRDVYYTDDGEEKALRLDKVSGIISDQDNNQLPTNISASDLDDGIQPAKYKVSYSDSYISYASIRSVVGDTASLAGMVATLLAFVGNISGVARAAGTALSLIGGANVLLPNSSNHGIKIRIKTTKYSRRRLGKWSVYKIVKSIDSVSKY